MDRLDLDDPRPSYQQLADRLRSAIATGSYGPGAKLPAHAVLAAEVGTSVGTVKRAFAELQAEGLIVTRQGRGAFVRTKPAPPTTEGGSDVETEADLRTAVSSLLARVAAIERRLDSLDV